MKMPKKYKTYCPHCKTHTEHEVEKVKKGRASTLTRIERQKARSFGIGNRGKFSKVPGGDKPTKKVHIRLRCLKCKKAMVKEGFRTQKFELVEE